MSKLTLEQLRADVAAALREEPEEIGYDDNLMDWGLDSLRVLGLVLRWNEAGADVDVTELAAETTLNGWWRIIRERQAG